MVSVKVKIRKSTLENKGGRLFVQIIHNREVKIIPTKLMVKPMEWDNHLQKVIPNLQDISRTFELIGVEKELQNILSILNQIISKLSKRKSYSSSDIVNMYIEQTSKGMLTQFMKGLIYKLKIVGKNSTASKYEATLRSFSAFRHNIDISFDNLTPQVIKGFEEYLKGRNVTMNTVSFYMRILRATYNKAVYAGIVTEQQLFKDVYTGIAKTNKRAIDEKVIKKLMETQFNDQLSFARDMFMISFYTRGMAYVDLANLKKGNLLNENLNYKRNKTNQELTMRIEPCMVEIIDRYAPHTEENESLLPIIFCDGKRINYSSAIQVQNYRLKKISELLNIHPPLTSYVSRHTWASIARKNGIPLSVISEGMGHTSEKTTQIYLSSLDQNVIDKANKFIIDYVKSKK